MNFARPPRKERTTDEVRASAAITADDGREITTLMSGPKHRRQSSDSRVGQEISRIPKNLDGDQSTTIGGIEKSSQDGVWLPSAAGWFQRYSAGYDVSLPVPSATSAVT